MLSCVILWVDGKYCVLRETGLDVASILISNKKIFLAGRFWVFKISVSLGPIHSATGADNYRDLAQYAELQRHIGVETTA